jgi:hypothetical protein
MIIDKMGFQNPISAVNEIAVDLLHERYEKK